MLHAAAARLAPAERVALHNTDRVALHNTGRVALQSELLSYERGTPVLNGNGSHSAGGHRAHHTASAEPAERVSPSVSETKDVRPSITLDHQSRSNVEPFLRYNGNGSYPSDPEAGRLCEDRVLDGPASGEKGSKGHRLVRPEAGPSRYPEEGPQCIEV